MTNALTELLYAAGYTKDDAAELPYGVRWCDSWGYFEYTLQFECLTVWETPCGLLKDGIKPNGWSSYLGVDYAPENNNEACGCPYYEEVFCPRMRPTPAGMKLLGDNCQLHLSNRVFDHEQSIDKIEDAWDRAANRAREALSGPLRLCRRMAYNRFERRFGASRDVSECLNCPQQVCVLSGAKRDISKVNIVFDVLREWNYKIGLINSSEKTITKGVKVFDRPVIKAGAEVWLNSERFGFSDHKSQQDHRDEYFSEHHGETGFGEYDYFNFTFTVQNIRIESIRAKRDLDQDLADIAEGLRVIHATDTKKAAAAAKKARIATARQNKLKRLEKAIVKFGYSNLDENTKRRVDKFLDGDVIEAAELKHHTKRWRTSPACRSAASTSFRSGSTA